MGTAKQATLPLQNGSDEASAGFGRCARFLSTSQRGRPALLSGDKTHRDLPTPSTSLQAQVNDYRCRGQIRNEYIILIEKTCVELSKRCSDTMECSCHVCGGGQLYASILISFRPALTPRALSCSLGREDWKRPTTVW